MEICDGVMFAVNGGAVPSGSAVLLAVMSDTDEPANREYNIGKRKWRQAHERDDVMFERRKDHLIADFDLEPHELYSYRKTLPTKMRPEKSGRNIIIKNPDDFEEWLGMEGLTDTGEEASNEGQDEEDDSRGFFSRFLG